MTITIATDGACANNQDPSERRAGIGFVVAIDSENVHQSSRYLGAGKEYTNNVAEYEAAIHAVEWVSENLDTARCDVQLLTDSQLVVSQTSGDWDINSESLRQLCNELRRAWPGEEPVLFQTSDTESEVVARADGLAKKAVEVG
jgi:ribonuclease HI